MRSVFRRIGNWGSSFMDAIRVDYSAKPSLKNQMLWYSSNTGLAGEKKPTNPSSYNRGPLREASWYFNNFHLSTNTYESPTVKTTPRNKKVPLRGGSWYFPINNARLSIKSEQSGFSSSWRDSVVNARDEDHVPVLVDALVKLNTGRRKATMDILNDDTAGKNVRFKNDNPSISQEYINANRVYKQTLNELETSKAVKEKELAAIRLEIELSKLDDIKRSEVLENTKSKILQQERLIGLCEEIQVGHSIESQLKIIEDESSFLDRIINGEKGLDEEVRLFFESKESKSFEKTKCDLKINYLKLILSNLNVNFQSSLNSELDKVLSKNNFLKGLKNRFEKSEFDDQSKWAKEQLSDNLGELKEKKLLPVFRKISDNKTTIEQEIETLGAVVSSLKELNSLDQDKPEQIHSLESAIKELSGNYEELGEQLRELAIKEKSYGKRQLLLDELKAGKTSVKLESECLSYLKEEVESLKDSSLDQRRGFIINLKESLYENQEKCRVLEKGQAFDINLLRQREKECQEQLGEISNRITEFKGQKVENVSDLAERASVGGDKFKPLFNLLVEKGCSPGECFVSFRKKDINLPEKSFTFYDALVVDSDNNPIEGVKAVSYAADDIKRHANDNPDFALISRNRCLLGA